MWMRCFSLSLLLLFSSSTWAALPLSIFNAWVREAPPGAPVHAAYLEIFNNTDTRIDLVSATAKDFKKVELHTTVLAGGMAKMRPLTLVEIAPQRKVVFAPGGHHFMLIKAKKMLQAGDRVSMSLKFSNGLVIPVILEVKKADGSQEAAAHQHHHH